MAVIYTVEQLQEVYRKSQSTTDKTERERLLNFILTESVQTDDIYRTELQFYARAYEIVLEEQAITQNSVQTATAIGIGSSNIYGYAVAGVATLYDLLTKKKRNAEINAAIQKVEVLKAKINQAAVLYESAQKDLNLIKIKAVFSSPLLWLVVVLVIIIFLLR